ncbi:hypothetical protein UFOVP1604_259 [uncultured Caudovirales phage]|uniref:Uncharacterized protein n=1 Tax=uncultured Caudovirales phage TaxID=2100421 RepID=A0A6J5SVZ8_9CAUD|nr:hypothetical protein UFOVP1604_259 [uncultured Caudovirales phage]
MSKKAVSYFIIGTFVTLYLLVSIISTIHVIDFFSMSNPQWLAISLAIAFEVGAAASLASLITLDKMNKGIVWMLFLLLTAMQAMGNMYYAYVHLTNFQGWIELFGLVEEELIYQKRVLSIVSGAILPIVALGFIKSLVDYIKPDTKVGEIVNPQITDAVTQVAKETPNIIAEPIVETTTQPVEPSYLSKISIEMPDVKPAEINEPDLNEVSKTAVDVQEIAEEPKVDNTIQRERKIDKELARGSNPGSGKIMFNDRP